MPCRCGCRCGSTRRRLRRSSAARRDARAIRSPAARARDPEQRLERVGAELRLEDEDRLGARQEDLVPVEAECFGVERRSGRDQGSHRVDVGLAQGQDDRQAARPFGAELEAGQALGDLGEHTRLCDARDRERLTRARLDHEAWAPVDAVAGGASDANLREGVVGKLADDRSRAAHPVEPERAGGATPASRVRAGALLLSRRLVASAHAYRFASRSNLGIGRCAEMYCGKAHICGQSRPYQLFSGRSAVGARRRIRASTATQPVGSAMTGFRSSSATSGRSSASRDRRCSRSSSAAASAAGAPRKPRDELPGLAACDELVARRRR